MILDDDSLIRHLSPSHYQDDKTSGEKILSSETFKPHSESNGVSSEVERLFEDSGNSIADRLIASNRKEYGALRLSVSDIYSAEAFAVFDPLDKTHQFGPNPFHSLIKGFDGLSRKEAKKLQRRLKKVAKLVLVPGSI